MFTLYVRDTIPDLFLVIYVFVFLSHVKKNLMTIKHTKLMQDKNMKLGVGLVVILPGN